MNKKAILLILIITAVGVWFILDFITIGPGLPPSEAMPDWYVPKSITDSKQECTPFFPKISKYCSYGNYTRRTMLVVWYFDDDKKFLQSENELNEYLSERGKVSTVQLDISEEIGEEIKRLESKNTWRPTLGPKRFDATKYESEITSGYFLVYKKPFLESREDQFIVYYGTKGSVNLSEQTPALKKLIAKSYYMANEDGTVEGLKR
ncbi:hypothetical protein LI82_12490 [Methanococcoides methylutens]|uniref:Uncharacterized protein n=1 Tax=Methanococcoides methylutens TaxID=2226 RepID=A0A099T025_METMT|nr:hypothetical protein [Methanococcoides methylutens]KGK98505.1 hypothetical protein LI82_12490 [Methanococcoides methylutens]